MQCALRRTGMLAGAVVLAAGAAMGTAQAAPPASSGDVSPALTQTIVADNVRMHATSDPASPTLMELNRGAVIDDHCYVGINDGVVMDHVTFQNTSGWVNNYYISHYGNPNPSCPA